MRPFFALLFFVSLSANAQNFVGNWKLTSTKRIANADEDAIYIKDTKRPEEFRIIEIKTNRMILTTAFDETSGLVEKQLYGHLQLRSIEAENTQAKIRLSKKHTQYMNTFVPNFDGNIKISLSENQSELKLEFPHFISIYQRITQDESQQLIKKKTELVALTKKRVERLFNLLHESTFNQTEVESTSIDDDGNKRDPTKAPASKVEVSYFRNDHYIGMNSESVWIEESDDQTPEDRLYREINIKTIKFEKLNENGTINILINEKNKGRMFLQLASESSPLYTRIVLLNYQGDIGSYRYPTPYSGTIFLKNDRLEFQTSRRFEDAKAGEDNIYRFSSDPQPSLNPNEDKK